MAQASGVLLGLLVAVTLLLAGFVAAVIRADLDATDSPAKPAPPAAVPAHALPAYALPAMQPSAPPRPPTAVRQHPRPSSRTPPSAHRWRPVGVTVVLTAGVIFAVTGGRLFLSTGTGACTSKTTAICAQGYVLLTSTQILGGVIGLAGIALIFTAAFLALREQD